MNPLFKIAQKMRLKQVLIVVCISLASLILFQNCAPGGSGESTTSSIAGFPAIESIEPQQNARVVDGALLCSGDCLITFVETADLRFTNVSCGGNLTITDNQLRCDNNLMLSTQ